MLEVRPKVFAENDGTEWRSVAGVLQARCYDGDEDYEKLDKWSRGQFEGKPNTDWLEFLRKQFPRSVAFAEKALANPMTAEEAEADDESINA